MFASFFNLQTQKLKMPAFAPCCEINLACKGASRGAKGYSTPWRVFSSFLSRDKKDNLRHRRALCGGEQKETLQKFTLLFLIQTKSPTKLQLCLVGGFLFIIRNVAITADRNGIAKISRLRLEQAHSKILTPCQHLAGVAHGLTAIGADVGGNAVGLQT